MRTLVTTFALMAGLSLAATPAYANGAQSWRVCGGTSFMTCSAVEVSVVGQNVTVRVWNLAMNQAGAYGQQSHGSVIVGLAFYNLPPGVQVDANSLQVSGPGYQAAQAGWQLRSYGDVGFAIDGRGPGRTIQAGIASGCDPVGSTLNLMTSPCSPSLQGGANWVTFNFTVTGHWAPSGSELDVLSWDSRTGEDSELWTGPIPNGQPGIATTVTPEPVSMTLLATGLAGLGGAGLIRRRKKA